MEAILMKVLDSGELPLSIIVGIFLVWFLRVFWPDYVVRLREKTATDKEIREREMAMEERLREKEIEAQNTSQLMIVNELNSVKLAINAMHATFNDLLQNLLSQYMEERKNLIDTGVFRRSDK